MPKSQNGRQISQDKSSIMMVIYIDEQNTIMLEQAK